MKALINGFIISFTSIQHIINSQFFLISNFFLIHQSQIFLKFQEPNSLVTKWFFYPIKVLQYL